MNITENINTSTSQKTKITDSDNINTKSSTLIFIYIVPCAIVLCIHFLALILLKRDRNFKGSQRYLIGALCCTEIVLSIQLMLGGVNYYYQNFMFEIAILFGESAGALMYFFVMTFVTLDRLAMVKLHLKYPIYCTAKRTITILFLAFMISVLVFVGLLTVYFIDKTNLLNWCYVLHHYLLTIFQGIFLIVAFITYIYIFKKLHKNRLASQKIINQLNTNPMQERDSKKHQSNPKIFVPSFIILTYILFGIIPHYLFIGLSIWNSTEGSNKFFQLIPILYFLGWCSDPIIYILSTKSIQQTIRRCIKSPG